MSLPSKPTSSSRRATRSGLSILFAIAAVFFGLCAAVALTKGLGDSRAILLELGLAAVFGALSYYTGRR